MQLIQGIYDIMPFLYSAAVAIILIVIAAYLLMSKEPEYFVNNNIMDKDLILFLIVLVLAVFNALYLEFPAPNNPVLAVSKDGKVTSYRFLPAFSPIYKYSLRKNTRQELYVPGTVLSNIPLVKFRNSYIIYQMENPEKYLSDPKNVWPPNINQGEAENTVNLNLVQAFLENYDRFYQTYLASGDFSKRPIVAYHRRSEEISLRSKILSALNQKFKDRGIVFVDYMPDKALNF